MHPETVRAIDEYWASDLGCRPEELYVPAVLVVPHAAGPADYHGVFALKRGPSCIISVPRDLVGVVTRASDQRKPDEVFDTRFLAGLFEGAVERIVGPAWLGYADASDFVAAGRAPARLLDAADDAALRRLAEACDPTEWEHSSLRIGRHPTFGCFARREIVAAAGYETWGGMLAHMGIITHPSHRRLGYGTAVASAATAHGLGAGLIAQWRTLASNRPSV